MGYTIQQRGECDLWWMSVNTIPVMETTYKVTRLEHDKEYKFRVVAVNKVGNGAPSSTSGLFKTKPAYCKLAISIIMHEV